MAFGVITILFNCIRMEQGGSDSVAALTIIWYAPGLFGGYINDISYVVSYNLGRGEKAAVRY